MRRLGCVLLVALVVLLGVPPAAAEGIYVAPVEGPLLDRFRPPANGYGPGNRGIDYVTDPGTEVRASAGGEVVFAGQVGGALHVVVLHPDGLRTSYSFLAEVAVRRGDGVARGDVVGRAGTSLHFGVRAGDDRYLDPEALLAGAPPDVHLIPVEERTAGSEAEERGGLLRSLVGLGGAAARAATAGVAWARDGAVEAWDRAGAEVAGWMLTFELLAHYGAIPARMMELAARAQLFTAALERCTPASTSPGPRRGGRRIAVLVGGLGSAAGSAAVLDVDTAALGYGPGDVAQFSYRGGQAPGPRTLDDIRTTGYGVDDSSGDILRAAAHLRDLLASIRTAHPGVPVDLIAHSQGGLVVRTALGEETDRHDPRLPPVEHVLTLGTPHQGADLATANAVLGGNPIGQLAQLAVRVVSGERVDPTAVATAQMAETSDFVEDLRSRPLPAGARVTSIAARGDVVVPALASTLGGATNVLVPVDGLTAHDALPGSPEATREMALALAGQGPTCRGLSDDLLLAAGIGMVEDGVGGALAVLDQLVGHGRVPASPGRPPGR